MDLEITTLMSIMFILKIVMEMIFDFFSSNFFNMVISALVGSGSGAGLVFYWRIKKEEEEEIVKNMKNLFKFHLYIYHNNILRHD